MWWQPYPGTSVGRCHLVVLHTLSVKSFRERRNWLLVPNVSSGRASVEAKVRAGADRAHSGEVLGDLGERAALGWVHQVRREVGQRQRDVRAFEGVRVRQGEARFFVV